MEIVIKRSDFVNALDKVSGVLAAKPAITLLTGIYLEARDGELMLVASDLENTIRTTIKAEVVKKGTCLLPGKKLISLVKQLKEDDVKMSLRELQMSIQTQNSSYTFFGMNPDEFPKLIDSGIPTPLSFITTVT